MNPFFKGAIILFATFILSIPQLAAQDADALNRQFWFMGLFNWKLSERWVFNEDISYQRFISEPSYTRVFTRSQINYQINGAYSLHGGVILSYKDDPTNGDQVELSPWVGAKLRWPSFWRVNFVNYVRLEERNRIDLDSDSGWTSVLRFRYRLSTEIPINHESITDNTLYAIAAYEYFSNESGGNEIFMKPATHRFDVGLGFSPGYRARYEVIAVFLDTKDTVTDEFDFTSAILFLRWRQNFNWR